MTATAENPYQSMLIDSLEEKGVEVVEKSFIPPYLLLWTLLKIRPDVLHLHWEYQFYMTTDDNFAKNIAAALLYIPQMALISLFTRIVWTFHDKENHNGKFKNFNRFMKRFTYFIADEVQIWDKNTRNEIIEYLNIRNEEKLTIIPHGSYIPVYEDISIPSQKSARESLELPEKDKVFLFFGYIKPYKQVELLIDKFKEGSKENCTLLIVGSPHTESYRRQILDKIEGHPNIRYIFDYVPEEDVPIYFSASDALVVPFNQIFNSGSVILGMSLSKLVLAPNQGSIKSYLPKENIVYDNFGEGFDKLLSMERSEIEDIGKENRNYARKHLDWESIAKKTILMYKNK